MRSIRATRALAVLLLRPLPCVRGPVEVTMRRGSLSFGCQDRNQAFAVDVDQGAKLTSFVPSSPAQDQSVVLAPPDAWDYRLGFWSTHSVCRAAACEGAAIERRPAQ